MRFLPELPKGHLYLLLAPRSIQRPLLNEFIARLALRGEVQALVCSNCFDTHEIAQRLRRHTEDIEPILRRIRLARAFTCYQVLSLLHYHHTVVLPTIVTDLPDLFFDESLPQGERVKLFQDCLDKLSHLSKRVQTLVSAASTLHSAQRPFLTLLQTRAETLWEFEPLPQPPHQLRLF